MDFHELSWKDWAITKWFANKLFAWRPACKENLRNFFMGFQTLQNKIIVNYKKNGTDQNSDQHTFFFFWPVLLGVLTTNRSNSSSPALWLLSAVLLTAVEEAITGGSPGPVVRDTPSQEATREKPSDAALTFSTPLCLPGEAFITEKQNDVNMFNGVGGGCLPPPSSCLITAELR